LPLNTSPGYGALSNIERTFRGYAAAGLAGIMIEDQVSPKRCGHTRGKGQGASRTLIVFFVWGKYGHQMPHQFAEYVPVDFFTKKHVNQML